ncbi:hypothetical protein MCOR31_001659 [Pyricularia oryzae]|nr:hypothetical protein MCOR31_001659 [Pyricularia oryzae]
MPLANRPCQSALRTWVVKAKKLESNLSRIFKLATRWKAILLLQVTVTVTGPQFTSQVNLTNIEETIRKAQFDGRQLRNTVAVTLGLARAACEDGCGDGKLTQEYLKMEFNSVAAFQKDFRFQMEFCKDAQNGMAKQLRTRGNGWCGG